MAADEGAADTASEAVPENLREIKKGTQLSLKSFHVSLRFNVKSILEDLEVLKNTIFANFWARNLLTLEIFNL